jgi:cation diffusion facilitator family transporter
MIRTYSVFRRKPAFSASMRAAGILIFLNALLFLAKVAVGVAYNSLAVLSDAGNSLTDVVTSIIILLAVRETAKSPDVGHHFGHARTEPLAAFTVAVLTCVLAAQVFWEAIGRLTGTGNPLPGVAPLIVLAAAILTKSVIWVMAGRMGRQQHSPAMTAAAMDAKMDVLISLMAMVGVLGTDVSLPWLDGVAALFIAAWIAYTGFSLGKVNIEKLLGAVPDPSIVRIIHAKLNLLKKQNRIRNFHELRIHYVGSDIHIAVHVNVDQHLGLQASHELDEDIQAMLQGISDVKHVALHIDPV